MISKQDIIDNFNILLETRVKNKENKFSIMHYRKFISEVKKLDDNDLKTFEDLNEKIKIGKKIGDKVKELYETGKILEVEQIKSLENFNDNRQKVIEDFIRIWDLGVSKAQKLYDDYGIKSLNELIALDDEKKSELLTRNQLIGLKYLEDFEKRIPRKEMDKHNEILRKIFTKVSKDILYEVVGSYRRGVETSGDIDVILTLTKNSTENINEIISKIVKLLKDKEYIIEDLAQGSHKYMGVCKMTKRSIPRRLDIISSTFNEYPFQILYFTGSPNVNIQMRNIAIKYGYSLSQYGLKDKSTGKYIDLTQFKNEKDIFDFLKIKYLEPIERTKDVKLEEL
jgi:DNA polymerase beta